MKFDFNLPLNFILLSNSAKLMFSFLSELNFFSVAPQVMVDLASPLAILEIERVSVRVPVSAFFDVVSVFLFLAFCRLLGGGFVASSTTLFDNFNEVQLPKTELRSKEFVDEHVDSTEDKVGERDSESRAESTDVTSLYLEHGQKVSSEEYQYKHGRVTAPHSNISAVLRNFGEDDNPLHPLNVRLVVLTKVTSSDLDNDPDH
jgi:hypothetical protein